MPKNATEMKIEEIGTELMSLKNAEKGIKARISELVEEAVKRGYAGEDIPTVGGDYVIALSEGTQRALNMDKACQVLGTEFVANLLNLKRAKIETLALSDLGTSIDNKTKDAISDIVEATVKATIRVSKK